MRTITYFLLMILAGVTLAGCSDDDDPMVDSLNGRWTYAYGGKVMVMNFYSDSEFAVYYTDVNLNYLEGMKVGGYEISGDLVKLYNLDTSYGKYKREGNFVYNNQVFSSITINGPVMKVSVNDGKSYLIFTKRE